MKNTVYILSAMLLFFGTAAADNKIKMVTYFPVPYMAYNDLSVSGHCYLGLQDNCSLDTTLLKVKNNLEVETGNLKLTGNSFSGEVMTIGSSHSGGGTLQFNQKNVTVAHKINALNSLTATDQAQIDNQLVLYGRVFPNCPSYNISWQQLGGQSYLVCGEGTAVPEVERKKPIWIANGTVSHYMTVDVVSGNTVDDIKYKLKRAFCNNEGGLPYIPSMTQVHAATGEVCEERYQGQESIWYTGCLSNASLDDSALNCVLYNYCGGNVRTTVSIQKWKCMIPED